MSSRFLIYGLILFISGTGVQGEPNVPRCLVPWPQECYALWMQKPDSLEQHASITQTDWVYYFATYGKPGSKMIVNTAAAAGIRNLWLRVNNGGWLNYGSNVTDATCDNSPYRGADLSRWDNFGQIVEYAHDLGIKVYGWFCPFEESHSFWDCYRSKYADSHPELASKDKNGEFLFSPSYFFEEYRDYKLSIVRELINRYELDGIVFDFERRGAPVREDRWDYLPQIVEEFKQVTDKNAISIPENDPQWRAFRAKYFTLFANDLKKEIKKNKRPFDLIIMTKPDNLSTAFINLSDLIASDCSALAIVEIASRWPKAGDPVSAFSKIKTHLNKIFVCYTYEETVADLIEKGQKAQDNGIDICWFETTPLYQLKKYNVCSRLGLSDEVLVVKTFDLDVNPQTVELRVMGLCDWELTIQGQKIVSGNYGREVLTGTINIDNSKPIQIEFVAKRQDSQGTGLCFEGKFKSKNTQHNFYSDKSWEVRRTDGLRGILLTVGQPGVEPFIANKGDLK